MRVRVRKSGFTLVETLVVMTIFSIVVAALVRLMGIGFPISRTSYTQAMMTETARVNLKRLVKNIREAKESDTGSYPLSVTEPQRLIFYSDVDADEVTERVRLELVGTDLVKGLLEPAGDPLEYDKLNEEETVIVSGVRNGLDNVFTYYGGDYPADTTPLDPADLTDVKYIEFYLSIDTNPDQDPPAMGVRTQVQLRNLKTNLGEGVGGAGK